MTTFTQQNYQFMQQAITLAKKGHFTTSPNPRVGCVLVNEQTGKVIGEGFHQKAGQSHAEVNALADAKQRNNKVKGATAYVTLEPCSHFGRTPPCAQALIDAGVAKVIVAQGDANPQVSGKGLTMLEQAGVETHVGLLEQAARNLNLGFNTLMQTKRPYVRCKLAASLDGKTAMASGESKWITGSDARKDVQRLRAQSCAIIAGADSILTDNAKMTVRWSELGQLSNSYSQDNIRQPVRVIIDSQCRLTPSLAIFQQPSPIILVRIINTNENSKAAVGEKSTQLPLEKQQQWPHFVEQVSVSASKSAVASGSNKVDLAQVLALLAKRGINDVLVESGARLAGAFIEQGLVDELILYQAPKLMGAEGKSLVAMGGIQALAQAKALSIKDIRMVGADIRITALFAKSID